MLGRRMMFVLSVCIALAIHGVLYWFAPLITLGRAIEAPVQERVREFRFHLREDLPAPHAPEEAASGGKGGAKKPLSTRPGAVRDLLARQDEVLKPDLGAGAPAPVKDFAARAGREQGPADPDLSPTDTSLRRVDAKIVEIARADARTNLDISRRVVRPSPERFFAPEEYPALRSAFADPTGPLVRFEPVGEGLLAKNDVAAVGRGELAEPGASAPAGLLFDTDALEPETLPLPAEIARASADREKARAVEEAPFQFLDDLVEITLQTFRAQGEEAGFFRVQVKLREGAKAAPAPRDVVFLIDASSSMQQRKLDAVAAGVRESLGALRPTDRFNVVLFRDSVSPFQPGLVDASPEHLEAARAFLKKTPSRGETDVYNALNSAIGSGATPGRASQLVVLSDGRATAGLRDAREIINKVTAANTARHAIYAYAGGNAIDRYLLELLAYRNRGAAAFAGKIEEMRAGFPKFIGQYAAPVLVNVQAEYSGLDAKAIFPRDLPDLSAARPYEIFGRYVAARDKDFVMRLSGRSGAMSKDLVFKLRFEEAEKGGAEIASAWAFQKSYALIAEIAERGEAPELLSELRGIGKKYGVRTVYSE